VRIGPERLQVPRRGVQPPIPRVKRSFDYVLATWKVHDAPTVLATGLKSSYDCRCCVDAPAGRAGVAANDTHLRDIDRKLLEMPCGLSQANRHCCK
jgi:hypothetical protein